MNYNLLIFCLIPALPVLVSGCGNNAFDQLSIDLSKGYVARFEDGKLDGHRVYGYDAAYLHDAIARLLENRRSNLGMLSETSVMTQFPLVYFLALKYEDKKNASGKTTEGECFRIQLSAVDFFRSSDAYEGSHCEWPSCRKCYTFFMVDDDGQVEILSVVPSRNFKSISSFQSKRLSYGSVNARILIWDAYMPDRNHPEKIFEGKYKKVFAVMTDQPFNYMAYVTYKRHELIEMEHSGSVYRLCWRTPQSMLFVPEALLPKESLLDPVYVHHDNHCWAGESK